MSDLSDFKRRVYEPEVSALKQRIATLERERDEARLDRNEARDVCFVLRARADRYEKAIKDAMMKSGLLADPLERLNGVVDVLRAALAGEDA